jgi:integrase
LLIEVSGYSCKWIFGGDTVATRIAGKFIPMPVLRLTKRSVDALSSSEKPFIAFDADLQGFGVRVMPTGTKSWVVEYRPYGGGRGVAKKRVTIGKCGSLTADQARKAAGEILAKVRLGSDPAAEQSKMRAAITVSKLIDAFETEHVQGKLKHKTGKSYVAGLNLLRDAHGSQKAASISRAQLATLHTKAAKTPIAANRALATWGKMFSWAAARGLIPEGHNPVKGIERYREQRRERFLTDEELSRLGAALEEAETIGLPWEIDETASKAKHLAKPENRRTKLDPFVVAAIRLLTLTGARLREVLDAQWSQVDSERGIIFLPDSKTGRKPIYLSPQAMDVINGLPKIEGNPYIIAGTNEGAPRADLKKPWRSICRVAGLEGVRIHDLRHTYASLAAGQSLGLPVIGKLLGHSQAATTHRYAHLDADPIRRAVNIIGERASGIMGKAKQ